MISVVCVFNDERVMAERLLVSLKSQTADYEVVAVDNRHSAFGSAAAALNHGAGRARGDWIIFIHQDVAFIASDWLAKAEALLRKHRPDGWAGVAGYSRSGKPVAFLRDRAALLGLPFTEPVEAQTLDEVLLIHTREAEGYEYFDERVPGWHAYGVEACCAAIRAGKKNYVISLPVWHDSKGTNLDGLEEAHRYVWQKHAAAFRRIYTTCGTLPDQYGWGGGPSSQLRRRVAGRLRAAAFRLYGYRARRFGRFNEALEESTEHKDVVVCLHDRCGQEPVEASAFVPYPQRSRRVIHHFSGLDVEQVESDCVIIAPDLSPKLRGQLGRLDHLRKSARRLLVCLDMDTAWASPRLCRSLLREAASYRLTCNPDGKRIALLDLC